jgi:hypothetical protein
MNLSEELLNLTALIILFLGSGQAVKKYVHTLSRCTALADRSREAGKSTPPDTEKFP